LVEPGFPARALAQLRARGHHVRVVADNGYGGYQAIGVQAGVWVGASESRKDGHAAGY
jgi:gamma-glutamyltranspeptidase/glutathione hydrolase